MWSSERLWWALALLGLWSFFRKCLLAIANCICQLVLVLHNARSRCMASQLIDILHYHYSWLAFAVPISSLQTFFARWKQAPKLKPTELECNWKFSASEAKSVHVLYAWLPFFSEDKTAHNWLPGSSYIVLLAWRVQRNHAKKPTAISLACWFCSHAQLINICLASVFGLHGCCSGWLSSLYVVRAFMYAS